MEPAVEETVEAGIVCGSDEVGSIGVSRFVRRQVALAEVCG